MRIPVIFLTITVALLQFGEAHNECVEEIRDLKDDLKNDLKDTLKRKLVKRNQDILDAIESNHNTTSEHIKEISKAAKENNQALNNSLTTGNQLILEAVASIPATTSEKVKDYITDKATKEDVHQRAVEVVHTLNNSLATGNELIMNTLQQMVESLEEIKTSGEQCVTRDEVQEIHNEIQTVAQTVERLQTVQTDMQSLIMYIAEKMNNTNQDKMTKQCETLLTKGQTTEQSTETLTIEETTEQSMSTTADPLYTCNGTPGWRQVVFINMTDSHYNCPPGLNLTSYSKRTCGRAHNNGEDCSSTTFSVGGSEYSQVCGRIRGYQVGSTNAFWGYLRKSQTIDGWYVEGVSLTHGAAGSREHIWSFGAGRNEVRSWYDNVYLLCPCAAYENIIAPPFVGNDYFCESGMNSPWPGPSPAPGVHWGTLFQDDPLWDGENCASARICCQFNNPPWFTKTLPNVTTDGIELRLCFSGNSTVDDTPLELIELYVQ